MSEQSNATVAERLIRRRARLLPVLGILFIAGQAIYFGGIDNLTRTVDQVRVAAWLVWAIVLLLVLAFAGGMFRGREVRALMQDESSRANRLQGYAWGFWTAMLACIGLYIVSMVGTLTGREALHIVVTFGIGMAILRFGLLERRALRGG